MDPEKFQRYFIAQGRFTAGVATRYTPSMITGEATFQHLAEGFPVGMRFHSAPVVRLADAKPVHLGHVARADGAWRVYLFADRTDPTGPGSRAGELCELLGSDGSPVTRFTPRRALAVWARWAESDASGESRDAPCTRSGGGDHGGRNLRDRLLAGVSRLPAAAVAARARCTTT